MNIADGKCTIRLSKHNREGAYLAWETVRETGYLFEKNSLKGKGMIKSIKFLYSVTRAFAKSCVDYFNVTGELPFIYRERQIHSALPPSIATVSVKSRFKSDVTSSACQGSVVMDT